MTGCHYPEEIKVFARKQRMKGFAYNTIVFRCSALAGRPVALKTVRAWCENLPPFRASKQLWAPRWIRRAYELKKQELSNRSIAYIIEMEADRPCSSKTVDYWFSREKTKAARQHRKRSKHDLSRPGS